MRNQPFANCEQARLKAFINGMWEFRTCCTTSYDAQDLCDAYDWGREWAHRLTLRHYDN